MRSVYLSFIILSGLLILLSFYQYKLFGSERNESVPEKISPSILKQLQQCDIVLRNGKGFISDVFRQFSLNDKRYSHAGIICVENNRIFVYHMLGGQSGIGGELRKEELQDFCAFNTNNSFAIYRYDLNTKQKNKMAERLKKLYRERIKFDSAFSLFSDSSLYCTELVFKLTNFVSGKNNYIPLTTINKNQYVAIDNLYLNRHATLIYATKN